MTPRAAHDPEDEKQRQLCRVGELLAELLENPMTPVAIHNDIADTVTSWNDDTSEPVAADLRQNWPRIAEGLTAGRIEQPRQAVRAVRARAQRLNRLPPLRGVCRNVDRAARGDEGENGNLAVASEIDELLALAFNQSPAYDVALDLYPNRHHITAGADLYQFLDEHRKKYLRRPRERQVQPGRPPSLS